MGGKKMIEDYAERHYPFEGCFNFRDIGGYKNKEGRRVKKGLYFRTGRQDRMTQKDLIQLKDLKINLPEAKAPVGNYVATKVSGKMLFVSGQISIDETGQLIKGKVGKDLDTEAGYNAAKRCALSIIAQVKKACNNDLSKVKSCVKLTGFVNSTDEFIDQPKVLNGASDLIASVFGDAGMHTRAAVSTNSLPLGVSVEVDAIFELK